MAGYSKPRRVRDNLLFPRAEAPHDEAGGVQRALPRVGNVGRDEEGVALADFVIHDPPVLAGLHDDVALELIEEFLGGGDVKVVPRVGATTTITKKFWSRL